MPRVGKKLNVEGANRYLLTFIVLQVNMINATLAISQSVSTTKIWLYKKTEKQSNFDDYSYKSHDSGYKSHNFITHNTAQPHSPTKKSCVCPNKHYN